MTDTAAIPVSPIIHSLRWFPPVDAHPGGPFVIPRGRVLAEILVANGALLFNAPLFVTIDTSVCTGLVFRGEAGGGLHVSMACGALHLLFVVHGVREQEIRSQVREMKPPSGAEKRSYFWGR